MQAAHGAPPSDNLYATDLPLGFDENAVKATFEQYGAVLQCKVLRSNTPQSKVAALIRFASVTEAQWVVENINGNIPQGLEEAIKVRFADDPATKAARQASHTYGKAGKDFSKGSSWGGWGGKDSWADDGWGGWGKGPYDGGKKGCKGKGKGKGGSIHGMLDGLLKAQALPGGTNYVNDENALYIAGLPSDTTDLELYKIFSAFGSIAPRGVRAMIKEDGSCRGIGFVNYLEASAAQAAIMSLHGTQLPDGSMLTVKTKAEPRTGPCTGKGKTMNGGKGEVAAAAIGWDGADQEAAWGQDPAWASKELDNMLAQMS